MASRKRKPSTVLDDGRRKKSRVNDDDDDISEEILTHVTPDREEALVRRLSQRPLFTQTQTSKVQREAGIIEEVRVTNFMSHSKLNFQYVLYSTPVRLFTQRRSVAKSVGCLQRHSFVCLFVNTITFKRVNIG